MKHLLFGFSFIFFLIQTSLSSFLFFSLTRTRAVFLRHQNFSHDYNNCLYAHILMVNGKSPLLLLLSPHFIKTREFIIPTHEFYCFFFVAALYSLSLHHTLFDCFFIWSETDVAKQNLIGNSRLFDCRGRATERKGKMFGYDFVSSVNNSRNLFDLFSFFATAKKTTWLQFPVANFKSLEKDERKEKPSNNAIALCDLLFFNTNLNDINMILLF